MASTRVSLKLEKPRRSTENDKPKIDVQSLTPEEKVRFADEKFQEMRLKNEKWAQRFDEIENDKKNAGFSGRRAFSKKSDETPPSIAKAPPKKQLEMNMTGSERLSYEKWGQERRKIDEERLERQKRSGEWRREWDKNKQEFYEMNDETTPPRQTNNNRSSFGQRNAYARFPTNTDGDGKFNAHRGFDGGGEKNFHRGGGFIRRENLSSTTPEHRENRQEESWDDEVDRRSKNNFQRYSEKREQKSVIIDQGDQKSKSRDQKIDDEIESWDREIAEYERKFAGDLIGDDQEWGNDSDSPPINVARLPSSLLDESPTTASSSTGTTSGAESGQFDDVAGADVKTPAAAAEKSSDDDDSEAEISRDVDQFNVSTLMNEIEQKMIEKMDENIKKAEAVLDDSGDEGEREDVEKCVQEILRQF